MPHERACQKGIAYRLGEKGIGYMSHERACQKDPRFDMMYTFIVIIIIYAHIYYFYSYENFTNKLILIIDLY